MTTGRELTMPDDVRVEELRRLSEAATPGPWPVEYVQWAVRHIARNVDAPDDDYWTDPEAREFVGWDRYKDGPFIAAAVDYVRAILAAPLAEGTPEGLDAAAEDVRYAGGNGVSDYWRGFNDGIDRLVARLDEKLRAAR